MTTALDDAALVARAQGGDAAAMNALLERHYDRIHAVCRRITGSAADADDAAQDALIKIVRGLVNFDGRSTFGTWAYRVATNVSLDELRRRRRRPQLHVVRPDDTGERRRGPAELADERAEHEVTAPVDRIALEGLIAGLPPDFRAPLVMRDVGDLDYAEIAEALDIPIGTVKSRIARARRHLVEQLTEQSRDERRTGPGNQPPGGERPTQGPPTAGSS